MLMVAWRLMTSGESGLSFEGSIVARSCFARCELFEAGAAGSSEILAAAMAAVASAAILACSAASVETESSRGMGDIALGTSRGWLQMHVAFTTLRLRLRLCPTSFGPYCRTADRHRAQRTAGMDDGGINLQALSFDQLNQLKQSLEEVSTQRPHPSWHAVARGLPMGSGEAILSPLSRPRRRCRGCRVRTSSSRSRQTS